MKTAIRKIEPFKIEITARREASGNLGRANGRLGAMR
jgi:hypothetical protein